MFCVCVSQVKNDFQGRPSFWSYQVCRASLESWEHALEGYVLFFVSNDQKGEEKGIQRTLIYLRNDLMEPLSRTQIPLNEITKTHKWASILCCHIFTSSWNLKSVQTQNRELKCIIRGLRWRIFDEASLCATRWWRLNRMYTLKKRKGWCGMAGLVIK